MGNYHVIGLPKVGNYMGYAGAGAEGSGGGGTGGTGGCECAGGLRIVKHTEPKATIVPGVLNVWGEVGELTLDFAPSRDGYAGEYCAEFVSGAVATVLSLPEAVRFADEPSIEANMRYQLSVVNNVGLMVGVAL